MLPQAEGPAAVRDGHLLRSLLRPEDPTLAEHEFAAPPSRPFLALSAAAALGICFCAERCGDAAWRPAQPPSNLPPAMPCLLLQFSGVVSEALGVRPSDWGYEKVKGGEGAQAPALPHCNSSISCRLQRMRLAGSSGGWWSSTAPASARLCQPTQRPAPFPCRLPTHLVCGADEGQNHGGQDP